MWWRDRRVSRPGTSSRFPEPLRVLIVGVNTATHVYHKEGSRFYGQTKKGKYVSEADAIKQGDRGLHGHSCLRVRVGTLELAKWDKSPTKLQFCANLQSAHFDRMRLTR